MQAAARLADAQGERLQFAMNAGMFHPDFAPVGLLVINGREVSPLNLAEGEGNFFPEGGDAPMQKVFDLEDAARGAGCELSSSKGSGVATHTASLDERVNYKDNPPTTGRHYQVPADDGVYNGQPPPDEALVHALEHGRVIIWVKPSLPKEERANLRALFDEDTYQRRVKPIVVYVLQHAPLPSHRR